MGRKRNTSFTLASSKGYSMQSLDLAQVVTSSSKINRQLWSCEGKLQQVLSETTLSSSEAGTNATTHTHKDS